MVRMAMEFSVHGIRCTLTYAENVFDGASVRKSDNGTMHVDFSSFSGALCIQGDDQAGQLHEEELIKMSASHEEPVENGLVARMKKRLSKDENGASTDAIQSDAPESSEPGESLQTVDDEKKESLGDPETTGETTKAGRDSELHRACACTDVTADQLQVLLKSDPQAASELDTEGRYPLRILSENEKLLSDFEGGQDARQFTLNFFGAYPEAMTTKDELGFLPFMRLIQHWVRDVHREELERQPSQQISFFPSVLLL